MNLPENYTCPGTTSYADVAPGYVLRQVIYGTLFFVVASFPARWYMEGPKVRGKSAIW